MKLSWQLYTDIVQSYQNAEGTPPIQWALQSVLVATPDKRKLMTGIEM